MPRIPNTRPTSIYWLFDTRPETLIEWPQGRPFYCGKTVSDVEFRFAEHCRDANRYPARPVSAWIIECATFVRVQIMQIVTASENWRECERRWIGTLRLLYPGCANVSDGGEGTPGAVHSATARLKMSIARKGKKHSPEHCAKIAAAHRGKIVSAATRAKMSAYRTGRPTSTGYRHSPESLAKMSAAKKGKPLAPDHLAKLVASRTATYQARKANAQSIRI
jgi:hypothetical protein